MSSPAPPALPTPTSSYATTVLAVLGVIVALWWGRSFMIPLTAGLMLALLVQPVTAFLTRWLRIRVVASALTVAMVMGILGLAGAAFGDQLGRVAGRVPDMINLVAQQVSDTDPGADPVLQRAREAFRQLDLAADRLAGVKPLTITTARGRAAAARQADAAASAAAAQGVSISQTATVALRESAVSGSSALFALAGDLIVVFFVAFFVLAGGPPLAVRFLDLWDTRPELRARAEHAAVECVRQVRIYGGVLLVTNTIMGLAVWAAFTATGLPDAGGWGITAAVLHVVPYLGMALLTGLGAAETFLAHGTLASAFGMGLFPGQPLDPHRHRRHGLAAGPGGEDECRRGLHRRRLLGRAVGRVGAVAGAGTGRAHQGRGRTHAARPALREPHAGLNLFSFFPSP